MSHYIQSHYYFLFTKLNLNLYAYTGFWNIVIVKSLKYFFFWNHVNIMLLYITVIYSCFPFMQLVYVITVPITSLSMFPLHIKIEVFQSDRNKLLQLELTFLCFPFRQLSKMNTGVFLNKMLALLFKNVSMTKLYMHILLSRSSIVLFHH